MLLAERDDVVQAVPTAKIIRLMIDDEFGWQR
jgi:hypothetical protein